LRRCSSWIGEVCPRGTAGRDWTTSFVHGVWSLDTRRDRVQLHPVSYVVFRGNRRRRVSFDIRNLRREPVALRTNILGWRRSHIVGHSRLRRQTWTLVVVIVRLRRRWLWRTRARSADALGLPAAIIMRLHHCGRTTWASCCGSRRGRSSCHCDYVPSTSITVCFLPHILTARAILNRSWRRCKCVLCLSIERRSMGKRCLVVR
jgi:hypothetical protein